MAEIDKQLHRHGDDDVSHSHLRTIIKGIPKAELHIHIEGSLEPEMMFEMGKRNNVQLPFESPEEVRAAYQFEDLQSFLDIYYQSAQVLLRDEDFYDLAWAYLKRAHEDGVRHVEAFFDPQTHTDRGVPFGLMITGLRRAFDQAKEEFGISFHLIMCFLRHLDESDAMKTLEASLPYRHWISAIGLDSSELGHPPEKFERVYLRARTEGYLAVAHAGEEGPAHNISNSLDLLKCKRIDHGVRCLEDPLLVERLVRERIPLTVCPMSNIKLRVFSHMRDHSLKVMMQKGLLVTANSDDPAYFGGYIAENFVQIYIHLNLEIDDLFRLAENSFHASFLDAKARDSLIEEMKAYRNKILFMATPALIAELD